MNNKHLFFPLMLITLLTVSCNSATDTNESVKPQEKQYITLSNDDEVEKILPQISNWNKWGEADEKGAINYISPEKIVNAANLIQKGLSVSLARQTSMTQTPGVREGKYEMQVWKYGSRDYVGAVWHGFSVTHLDGLCHVFADTAHMYNGYPVSELTEDGAQKLGLEKLAAQGISGRGVLIDAAEYLEGGVALGQALMPSDLDYILAQQNITVESGDILFIRTGLGEKNTRGKRAGLHPSCVLWMHEKEIALLGGDGDNDAYPVNFERWMSPFHTIGIPYLGLPIIDNAELDALSKLCKQENRYAFFITINPWRIKGTTSCPINPVAIF